jgi:hypothetical protein
MSFFRLAGSRTSAAAPASASRQAGSPEQQLRRPPHAGNERSGRNQLREILKMRQDAPENPGRGAAAGDGCPRMPRVALLHAGADAAPLFFPAEWRRSPAFAPKW